MFVMSGKTWIRRPGNAKPFQYNYFNRRWDEMIFGILQNSLSTILKDSDAILKQFDSSSPVRKWHRSGAHTLHSQVCLIII